MNKSQELLQKLHNLYNRPGTPGEKKAAKAAIDRVNKNLPKDQQVKVKSPKAASGTTSAPKPDSSGMQNGHYVYHINKNKKSTYYGPYKTEKDAVKKFDSVMTDVYNMQGDVVRHDGNHRFTGTFGFHKFDPNATRVPS